ncbi:MFS transporter [Streptomyces sp. ODS28]|uniref:MFS transporter n=1 Tax=Streptomyces sp. ODS28 TaxID=3136688 RepID=UPI0031EAA190
MAVSTPPAGPRSGRAETSAAPRRGLITAMAAAQAGLYIALLTPVFSALALKIQTIVPPQEQVAALATVSSAGAVAAFLANPVFGRLSDRTTGRLGRRRPWMAGGVLGLFACLAVIALAPNVLVMTVGWFCAQACANAALAAYLSSMADQVPPARRGKVSGLIGLMQNAGMLAAAYAGHWLGGSMLLLFLVPGVIGLAAVCVYAVVLPDKPLSRRPAREGGVRTVLRTFWVSPRQHPDFAWAFASRFLIILASYMFTTYRLLYLQQELRLPAAEATGVMATGVLIYTLVLMAGSQAAGWASDRLGGRRKIFVGTATLVFGIGTALLVHVDSVSGFYVAEAVLGLGYGVYIGVDLALVVDLLPDPDNAAKDLGVFNIANAGPQALAPAVAGLLVGVGGGQHYGLMLTVAALVCVAGALAVVPIRSVR